jgi:hypothetical protein
MKCVIPIEVSRTIRGEGRILECVPSLFPSYLPESKHLKEYLVDLNDKNHHVDSLILRNGVYTFIGTTDQRIAFNTYFIPEYYSDSFVVSYFTKYQGWPRRFLSRIKYPLRYKHSRKDKAQALYQWEKDVFNQRLDPILTEKEAKKLAKHYLEVLGITNYSMKFQYFNSLYEIAKCIPVRHSGIVAPASEYLLAFSPNLLSASTILHEIAHVIDYERYRALNHGPTFMLNYNMLLRDYFDKNFLPSMKEAGLYKGKQNGR